MKIGLFFGSFNPVHIGHMAIANYVVEYSDIQQLWFVISPQNPFKTQKTLLSEYQRLELIYRAIGDSPKYKVSTIEFSMPKPSYTIDTLTYLTDKYPNNEFVLIAGADILPSFHKWKNYEQILEYYEIYVYPRPGIKSHDLIDHPKITMVKAPVMDISSSMIRRMIKEGKTPEHFVPHPVWEYIDEMNFYK